MGQFQKRWQNSKHLMLLFLPALIYYLLFKYVPMFGILISFKDYNTFKGVWASEWVGLKYYSLFFHSPDFLKLLKNTVLLGISKVVFGFPAPIILALLLNEVRRAALKRLVQSISYLPHFISNVVVVSMMFLFLSPTSGLVNNVIQWFGYDAMNFMQNEDYFRAIYILSEIWQHVGWETIIYLAALSAIDPQLYEAARVDGANRRHQLLHITIPGIRPAIIILFILNIGHVLDIGFEKVLLMLNPSIYATADVLSTYVYRTGIQSMNYSYATAIDLFSSIINLIFILTANWISRRTSETSLW
ncbi:putative multiple-sugar transport system permease YteP [Paenibacillus allorhizoplanae]|uniref:Multiple-sugar transport system permease YteP n=1 Tax=Paenibacillus allorhizoplanae TaxID=2905648 RepID=A0ABN8GE70_9BACL|nr:ABC transporter permease subunit [Paenibacillus allorhizoplanae]CAH1200492.1 putative multiple-sugar transport system permease YteP [Paenibacillus allorhizoplanae]